MNSVAPSHTLSEAEKANARGHAEAVVQRSGTSFFWAMRSLPDNKRHGMYAVYAFCREVDDIADEPGIEAEKREELNQWRIEVDNIFANNPQKPTGMALIDPIQRFGLHKKDFLAVIDGMEMDAGDYVRIQNLDELALYNDRVACAVGRLSNRVFGVEEGLGDRVAMALGNALQLTNILRDITEDAGRNRLYLPVDKLVEAGCSVPGPDGDLRDLFNQPGLSKVCQELAVIADKRFQEAEGLLAECDQNLMKPAIMMKEVYHRIFQLLQRRGWQDIEKPVSLSKMEKLWIGLRYGFL